MLVRIHSSIGCSVYARQLSVCSQCRASSKIDAPCKLIYRVRDLASHPPFTTWTPLPFPAPCCHVRTEISKQELHSRLAFQGGCTRIYEMNKTNGFEKKACASPFTLNLATNSGRSTKATKTTLPTQSHQNPQGVPPDMAQVTISPISSNSSGESQHQGTFENF